MKKVIAIGALCATVAGFAADSAISSDIVGYSNKDTAAAKWSILGVQFTTVKGEYKLNDLVSGLTGVNYDDGGAWKNTAPQIQVPNGVGYDLYYYLNDAWDEVKQTTVPGWADTVGNLAPAATVTPGVAVWLKSPTVDGTACVSGAVDGADSADVACPVTFALRANVFPVSVKLNTANVTSSDIVGSTYDEGGTWKNTAPQIQIPNGVGYDLYYYLTDAWDEVKQITVPGWADTVGNLATGATITTAQGFWTKGVGSPFTLTFVK